VIRVAVFSAIQTPKWVIFSELDRLHGEHGLRVIGWTNNHGGAAAVEWAIKRPGAESVSVAGVEGANGRAPNRFFDSRASITVCFKLYQPDRAILFCSPYWITSGVGRTIMQQAAVWQVPVHIYGPTREAEITQGRKDTWKEPFEMKVVELCNKTSPRGRICTRFKGHEGGWHWSYKMGKQSSQFWSP
jgi:hypothetical protein